MVSFQYNHLTGQWQLTAVVQDENRYFIPSLPGDPPAILEIPADVSQLLCHGPSIGARLTICLL